MRMDENINPEWVAMLKGSSHGKKALEQIESLREKLEDADKIIEALEKQSKSPCLECGGDKVIARIARDMGHRPDIAYAEARKAMRERDELERRARIMWNELKRQPGDSIGTMYENLPDDEPLWFKEE